MTKRKKLSREKERFSMFKRDFIRSLSCLDQPADECFFSYCSPFSSVLYLLLFSQSLSKQHLSLRQCQIRTIRNTMFSSSSSSSSSSLKEREIDASQLLCMLLLRPSRNRNYWNSRREEKVATTTTEQLIFVVNVKKKEKKIQRNCFLSAPHKARHWIGTS